MRDAFSHCVEHFDDIEGDTIPRYARRTDIMQRQELAMQWAAFITARIEDDTPPLPQHDGAACVLCNWLIT